MLGLLLAYDTDGNVVATLDLVVSWDGNRSYLIDSEAHEAAGGALTDIWEVAGDAPAAIGSGTWPEWLGGRAHDFRVELEPGWSRSTPAGDRPAFRIRALVHRTSGHRRERAVLAAEIQRRIDAKRAEADGTAMAAEPADIRDLVGGPDRPLVIDDDGRTVTPTLPPMPLLPRFEERLDIGRLGGPGV